MGSIVALLGIGLGLAFTAVLWQRIRVQQLSRERLAEAEPLPEAAREEPAEPVPFVQNHYLIPWLAGLAVATIVYYAVGWPAIFAATFGLMAGLLGGQLELFRISWVTFRIEQQLADALDLMAAALQAGAGTMSAMENAVLEARAPLRPQLEEVLGRIRYGDDPAAVLHALEQRVPLEVFRLFVSALTVHWETGGSLAPTLATVGRVVRDRIEVNRRIRSLTTQARVSVIAVLCLTYFLAVVMWRNDPARMQQFLATAVGQYLAAGALLLQAVGMVWSSALSRLKY
jgi:Flp pilus assembly protein TadB